MLMSEKIAMMIEQMLNDSDGTLELRRNELATRMGCVPSQINYVITSRFGKDRGYIVESRRGGGGYVRITKLNMGRSTFLCHLIGAAGEMLSESDAAAIVSTLFANGLINDRESSIISSCISPSALNRLGSEQVRAVMRSEILKAVMFDLMQKTN